MELAGEISLLAESYWEPLTESSPARNWSLEPGGRSQEERGRRKEEEGRSQKKCFYKDEMLPNSCLENVNYPHSTWESCGFRSLFSTVNC